MKAKLHIEKILVEVYILVIVALAYKFWYMWKDLAKSA